MSFSIVSTLTTPAATASQTTLNPAAKKIGQDLNTLAQALGGNDASSIKNAFASLLQDLLSQTDGTQSKVHHHHRHHGGADQASAAGSANAIPNSISAPAAGATPSFHVTA
jgi:hypothetical protein